jgi:CRISPR-associated protein Cas2
MSDARLYLVAYDVACPKRWRRVVKLVKSICQRGQLSVFLCRATPPRIARLEADLRRVLHHRDDRLMILDLGPAHSSAAQVRSINAISDIADLDAAVL